MLRFPRTIRLDPSDTLVFERAAEPGEWAVSGAFVFWNQDLATLGQKQRRVPTYELQVQGQEDTQPHADGE